jgi:hypothetical protein
MRGVTVSEISRTSYMNIKRLDTKIDIKNLLKPKVAETKELRADKMKGMYFNARSILNKLEELKIRINKENPDIIGISESWLHEGIDDSIVTIPGYVLYRKDRCDSTKCKGGGVMFYVKVDIQAEIIEFKEIYKFDYMWLKLKLDFGKEGFIGVFYRPPELTEEYIKDLKKCMGAVTGKLLWICGDFNYGGVDWKMGTSSNSDRKFMECVNDLLLYQMVKESTRENRILDLVLTTDNNTVGDVEITEPVGNSDHNTISFEIIVEHRKLHFNKKAFNYNKGDYSSIGKELNMIDWNKELANKPVDDQWEFIKDKLIELRNKYIPSRRLKDSTDEAWMNKKVKKMIVKKKKYWSRYQKRNTYSAKIKYKKMRNKVIKAIRRAKAKFEQKLAIQTSDNRKSFYAYANKKKNKSQVIGPLIRENGEEVEDIPQEFNNFFASVFTKETNDNYPEVIVKKVEDQSLLLGDLEINEDIIEKIISRLKMNKSPGEDEINSIFLIKLKEQVKKPLVILFKKSYNTAVVPGDWKKAKVTPIYKKGSKRLVGNYRPVSLTSQICKVFEKLLKNHISNYMEEFCLLRESQHGFRENRSCLTNLIEHTEYISASLDDGSPVDVFYLDLQKAFDKVPHKRLLHKLEAFGIKDKNLNWIRDWLKNREQVVNCNQLVSEKIEVISGVPQGSVLGPLLFTLYIDDLDEEIKGKILKFADDTKLSCKVKTAEERVQALSDLDRLNNWSKVWMMPFNIEKCKVMHMGRNNPNIKYALDGIELKSVEEEDDLGVKFKNTLSFSGQCEKVVSKVNGIVRMIYKTISSRSAKVLIPLFKSLVRPKLEYCIQVWRPSLKQDISLIERVQRRFTRAIKEVKGLKYKERLDYLGLNSLEARALRADLLLVFKVIKLNETNILRKFFTLNTSGRRGNCLKLFKGRSRLNVRQNCFSNRVVEGWNSLNDTVVLSSSVNVFKSKIGRLLSMSGELI